jgi:LPXTG-motif cell wall-anchored protein
MWWDTAVGAVALVAVAFLVLRRRRRDRAGLSGGAMPAVAAQGVGAPAIDVSAP